MAVSPLPVMTCVIIGAMVLTVSVWNSAVGLSLVPTVTAVFSPAALMLLVAGWSSLRRGDRRISEAALYLGLRRIWPQACVWISYLAVTIGYPLQDQALAAADAAPGFHWIALARFVEGTAWLGPALDLVYVSAVHPCPSRHAPNVSRRDRPECRHARLHSL